MRSSPGIAAAFSLALMSAAMAVPACAHASPTAFVNCMADAGKGAAFINAVEGILDGENRTQVLEHLAVVEGPAVLKCALEQVAAKKAAGGDAVGSEGARRAREYLDSHGGSASRAASPLHLTIVVPLGAGRFEAWEVDPATQMSGARPIGLTDRDDAACRMVRVDRKTGERTFVRYLYCATT